MIDREIQNEIDKLKKIIDAQQQEIEYTRNLLRSPRVVVKNFEGAFKVLEAAPTTTDTQEGCIYLTNVGGVYGLYARINNGWRTVSLT